MKESKYLKLIFTCCFMFIIYIATAQLPADMSKVKSADISEAQLQEFIQKATSSGYNMNQIEMEFAKRGMSENEVSLLRPRLKRLMASGLPASTASPVVQVSRNRSIAKSTFENNPREQNDESRIFGSEFFSSTNNTFEPNLRIATPKNYILGPDDELSLEVYGTNLAQQNLKVSAEGQVNVKYVGMVSVNGLTIEEATRKIIAKLTKFYPGITSGQTKVQISLATIRTIKVSIIGATKKPGTYSVPSVASLFNVLYIAGGPSENGSYRNIELVRNNKIVLIADFYDYLLKADQKNNIRLEDNDVIRIPFAKVKISLDGEVNRPGIFEIQPNEVLADAIKFAGNFKSTAFKARITGTRLLDLEKEILDITKNEYNSFKPIDGDEYLISQIIDKYQNRVTINGAIYKPGTYALNDNLRLSDLLSKAEGLRDDAYSKRITIKRTKDDLSKEILTVDLTDENAVKSFQLKKEDEIEIASIFELKDMYSVTINGAVRKPGIYDFNDSLSLKTLILEAGGFADNATGAGIEISRRKRDAETNIVNGKIVEIIKIDDVKDLSQKSADLKLKPFDIVSIKIDPYYKPQISVSIVGEVFQPGSYSLQSREENISSLIKRSGGLLYTANISGARMRRKNNVNDIDLTVVKKIAQTAANDSSNVLIDNAARSVNDVAINLEEILKNPGGPEDIFLAEGDEIYIPVINNMISIEGEVFKPLDVAFTYEKGKKLKEYISDAGGTTSAALEKKIFVIYANGRAAQTTKKWLFFRKYPKVEPGCKIFVPKAPKKAGFDAAKASVIVSSIGVLLTSLFLISQIGK